MNEVEDIFEEGRQNSIKFYVLLVGALVYLGAVVYCEIHNISLLLRGVAKGGEPLAMIGMVCLGATAIMLPLAIHFWTHEAVHKTAAFLFYLIDFGLIIMNVVVDYNNNSANQALPDWVKIYVAWITPIGPVLCAVGWSILWLLDPVQKERAEQARIGSEARKQKARMAADTRLAYIRSRRKYALEDADYQAMIESAAVRDQMREGRAILGGTPSASGGGGVSGALPSRLPQPNSRQQANRPKGPLSFFAPAPAPAPAAADSGNDDDDNSFPNA